MYVNLEEYEQIVGTPFLESAPVDYYYQILRAYGERMEPYLFLAVVWNGIFNFCRCLKAEGCHAVLDEQCKVLNMFLENPRVLVDVSKLTGSETIRAYLPIVMAYNTYRLLCHHKTDIRINVVTDLGLLFMEKFKGISAENFRTQYTEDTLNPPETGDNFSEVLTRGLQEAEPEPEPQKPISVFIFKNTDRVEN